MKDDKIFEQINEILKNSNVKSRQVFVFEKLSDKKWHVESPLDNTVDKSEHTSRVKALNSFFSKQSGLKKFYIVTE
jgi:hypothetical protein